MNIIQAVKYMMRVLIPQITHIAGEGIDVAKEKEGSVISATFPGWLRFWGRTSAARSLPRTRNKEV